MGEDRKEGISVSLEDVYSTHEVHEVILKGWMKGCAQGEIKVIFYLWRG